MSASRPQANVARGGGRWQSNPMLAVTILIVCVAVFSAAATNAVVQQRLLEQGGRWFPSTVESGLSGIAFMVGVLALYFGIGSIIVRLAA